MFLFSLLVLVKGFILFNILRDSLLFMIDLLDKFCFIIDIFEFFKILSVLKSISFLKFIKFLIFPFRKSFLFIEILLLFLFCLLLSKNSIISFFDLVLLYLLFCLSPLVSLFLKLNLSCFGIISLFILLFFSLKFTSILFSVLEYL